MKKSIFSITITLMVYAAVAFCTIVPSHTTLAATGTNPCQAGYVEGDLCEPLDEINQRDTNDVWDTAAYVVTRIIWGAGILAVIMIIVSSIRIASSGGDAEKVKKGKLTLMWAVIGLAIALLAGTIITIVSALSGNF